MSDTMPTRPGPTLTVIHMRPDCSSWRRARTDPVRMHTHVMAMVAGAGGQGRELWASPTPERLLVQYTTGVDPAWLPDGWVDSHTTVEVRSDWPAGSRVRWALLGNPIKKTGPPRVDGIRTGSSRHVPRDDADRWAVEKLPCLDHHHVAVLDRYTTTGRRNDGRYVTLRRARITGEATVVDPDTLAVKIGAGVGDAKAYGCGLLLVQPAPRGSG